jgi:hypothetical protein
MLSLRFFISHSRWEWDNCGDGEFTKREAIDTDDIDFPAGFLWGTATAAHQVEGDCNNNQWWQWEHAVDAQGASELFVKSFMACCVGIEANVNHYLPACLPA